MSRSIKDSSKLKLAKYLLEELRKIDSEREKSTVSGAASPVPEISINKLIEDTGFPGKASTLTSSEVIKGMFFKRGDRLIPDLGIRSLAEFNGELEEQIKMYEGAFGRESLRHTHPHHVESGFVHNAARRK